MIDKIGAVIKVKRIIYIQIIICTLAGLSYINCEVPKRLKKIVDKINKGNVTSLSDAVKIINNIENIRKKFKVWKFFLENTKTNKFAYNTFKNLIWQSISKNITKIMDERLANEKVCSFYQIPQRVAYAYSPQNKKLYLSTDIPYSNLVCKKNTKIVDEIKHIAWEYPGFILKAIVYREKQNTYVNTEDKHLYGPYKNADYIYYDNNYENFAFLYNGGTGLNFNGTEIKLQYTCTTLVLLSKNKVALVCNSKKYRNYQFLYSKTASVKSVLCDDHSIIYANNENGDIVYLCKTKSLASIFLNNRLIKRYSQKFPHNVYIRDINISSKYITYTIFKNKDTIRVIYDITSKQFKNIESNSNIILAGNNYFYCKWKEFNLIVYKNGKKFIKISKDRKNLMDFNLISRSSNLSSSIYLAKLSDRAFYFSYYNQYEGGTTYIIFFVEGRYDIIRNGDYLYNFSKKGNNIFYINTKDSENRRQCYFYYNNRKVLEDGYHCYIYNIHPVEYILIKPRGKKKAVIYLKKYKKRFEISGPEYFYDRAEWYIGMVDGIFYLYNLPPSWMIPQEDLKFLFLPLARKKAVIFSLSGNTILGDFIYNTTYTKTNFSGLYFLSKIPSEIIKYIKTVRNFCKHQKKLCKE